MTCIAALIHNGKVYIGGDSAAIADDAVEIRTNPKVFRNGDYVLGFTGSYRTGQLLQYVDFEAPGADVMAHLVKVIVPQLKAITCTDDIDELIIGCRGRLFKISADYSVAEYANYTAAGGGEPYALGRLHGSLGPPDVRIIAALEAAQEHCASVRAPFRIEVL